MKKDYRNFPDNFIEDKEIAVGDTVFAKSMANTLNRLLDHSYFSLSYNHQSVYGEIVEIGKKSFKVKILELVDINLQSGHAESKLVGQIINTPKTKCLQWGKGKNDPFPRCHWIEK